jgi:hypothetical protein
LEYRPRMTFIPREMLSQPRAFGASTTLLSPASGVGAKDPRYLAALLQHVLAFRVTEQLRDAGQTRQEYLEPLNNVHGLGVDRMGRVLRGEQMATTADFAFWVTEFPSIARHVAQVVVNVWGGESASQRTS